MSWALSGSNCGWSTDSLVTRPSKHVEKQTRLDGLGTGQTKLTNLFVRTADCILTFLLAEAYKESRQKRLVVLLEAENETQECSMIYIFSSFQPESLRQTVLLVHRREFTFSLLCLTNGLVASNSRLTFKSKSTRRAFEPFTSTCRMDDEPLTTNQPAPFTNSFYVGLVTSHSRLTFHRRIYLFVRKIRAFTSGQPCLGEFTYTYLRQKWICLLYTSPSPRDRQKSRMPSSA